MPRAIGPLCDLFRDEGRKRSHIGLAGEEMVHSDDTAVTPVVRVIALTAHRLPSPIAMMDYQPDRALISEDMGANETGNMVHRSNMQQPRCCASTMLRLFSCDFEFCQAI